MSRVLSYCWFWHQTSNRAKGHFSRFAPAVMRAAHAVYPDHALLVYHDASLAAEPYGEAMRRLDREGVLTLVECRHGRGISEASLWRLKPIWDDGVDLVVCRDLDSIPTVRERCMVDDFARSSAALHAINDTPEHESPHWPNGALLTGTSAYKTAPVRGVVRSWRGLVDQCVARGLGLDAYGHDETGLNGILQPFFVGRVLCHRRDYSIPHDVAESVAEVVDAQLAVNPRAFTEYIGMCLQEPERAASWLDRLECCRVFKECGA